MKIGIRLSKIWIYRILILLLLSAALAEGVMLLRIWVKDNWKELGFLDISKKAPYYDQVKTIIEPLRYSRLQILLSNNVYISFDFEKQSWTLHNIFRYGPDGNVLLEDGKYGLCGELAVYTYGKIRPIFNPRYKIQYIRVSESGYFISHMDGHFALMITDTSSLSLLAPDAYIIDPSFHIYKHIYDLDTYAFHETYDELPLFRERRRDKTSKVNRAVPLLITKKHLIGITVTAVNGKFDNDNYMIAIIATKRNSYSGRHLFALRKNNGEIEVTKNDYLIKQTMTADQRKLLSVKLEKLFYDAREERSSHYITP